MGRRLDAAERLERASNGWTLAALLALVAGGYAIVQGIDALN